MNCFVKAVGNGRHNTLEYALITVYYIRLFKVSLLPWLISQVTCKY